MSTTLPAENQTDAAPGPETHHLSGLDPTATYVAARNLWMMHLLERIALQFNRADIPLMALKGAALNLTVYDRPQQRPMSDLDLMVRAKDLDAVHALLERIGCLRSQTLVREDFFPHYYYEIEYRAGEIDPVTLDVHVRPLRPLRYSRFVPDDALWRDAKPTRIGEATLLLPSPDQMLIHLAAHSAIHGNQRDVWLEDIRRWIDRFGDDIDPDQLVETARAWRLALPVREGLRAAVREGESQDDDAHGSAEESPVGRFANAVLERLDRVRVNWRDRLAIWHAPRDNAHPAACVLANVLTTPNLKYTMGYLQSVLVPGRAHMSEWYAHRHPMWLPCAHAIRVLRPVVGRIPGLWTRFQKVQTRRSGAHGTGVVATRNLQPGELIARYHGKPIDRLGTHVACAKTKDGKNARHEITGRLRFLNHSCRPNARFEGFKLLAVEPIRVGHELFVDYGPNACDCRRAGGANAQAGAAQPVEDQRNKQKSMPNGYGAESGKGEVRALSSTRRTFITEAARKAAYAMPVIMLLAAPTALVAQSAVSGCGSPGDACVVDGDCCQPGGLCNANMGEECCLDTGTACTLDSECCGVMNDCVGSICE